MGPIYGPEDLLGGWVSKRKPKRKADSSLQLPPAKRPVSNSKPDFSPEVSDADDEDDQEQRSAEAIQHDEGQQSIACDEGHQSAEEKLDDNEPVASDTALVHPESGPFCSVPAPADATSEDGIVTYIILAYNMPPNTLNRTYYQLY